ncbi:MAG: single-stranded DNA-binding protein [Oscillibacter sp.]|nr:single-stranded DNA-binding protein [Oscillibacter sp.]
MTNETRNEVLLEGTILETPVLSHENHGARFYRFPLQVPRLSGQVDLLPVLLAEPMLPKVDAGETVRIQGQLRSFNNRSGIGSRLVLTVYAQEIEPGLEETVNQILLSGALCKPPIFRRTPLGRSICDLMLAVPRRYGRADYLPVIAWGQLAVRAGRLQVGDPLSLEGRVQSRTYRKVTDAGTEERTAYEVSMMHMLDTESV